MAFVYRWLGSDRPEWDDMSVTTLLNDGSVGDLTTGEDGTDSSEGTPPYCQAISAHAYCTGTIFLGTSHTITGFSFALRNSITTTANNPTCTLLPDTDPPVVPDPSARAVLEYSTNGATWTEVTRVSCNVPAYSTDGTTLSETTTYSGSFSTVTACWIRLVSDHSYAIMTGYQTMDVATEITDFRLTATDTGNSCGYPPSSSCDVALSASVTPSTAAVGASGTFTITATNNGPDATSATEVTILSPIGFTSPAYTPSQGTVTAGVWTIGAIAVGANKSCTIAGTIGRNGQLILSASVTGTTPDDVDTGNSYARATLVATPAAGTGCHCSEVHDGPCSGSFVFDGPCSGTWVVDDCPGGGSTTVSLTWDTTDYTFDTTAITFDATEE